VDRAVRADSDAYENSLEHVLAELERLDLLLQLKVQRFREFRPATRDEASGPVEAEPGVAHIAQRTAEIRDRAAASVRAGAAMRLVVLAQLFDLVAFDVDVVMLCLAPELDRCYERMYAYLHDDVTCRQPTAGLALDMFCDDMDNKVVARHRFSAEAPLVRHRIVHLADGPTLLATPLRLDPRVTEFLLGHDQLDERLLPLARVRQPTADLDDLVLPSAAKERVAQLTAAVRVGGADVIIYLHGPYGVGKQSIAEACCRAVGADLLVIDGRRLAECPVEEFAVLAPLVVREARLQGALLHIDGFDALFADDKRSQLGTLLTLLEQHRGLTFLAGEAEWEPADVSGDVLFVRLALPEPSYEERLALWRAALPEEAEGIQLTALANAFRLTGGQIADAVATARSLALDLSPGNRVTQDDLVRACRLRSNRKLGELALQVTPRHTWDDLVLPADQLAQLHELADQVRYRSVVHDTWGFGHKIVTGRGLNALFTGPPGTGKTMAAQVLAATLGLDLYKVDLATVLSKYIGETERNLGRIFDEARTSNAVLFFDEADALFGKRTQVRDAHDRYANVEVAYLLQRMEEHEGLVVLATNLGKNMDEAFVRRLHVTIEFPMPGAEDRRRIWMRMWPAPAPVDPELDLELLAREVEVSGGAIRNITLASAFLAAADGGVVTMRHLLHATRREYKKMGKVLTSGESGWTP
jgi:SpoVK/Ycf46/Vps4 family AAA+-type ATPase